MSRSLYSFKIKNDVIKVNPNYEKGVEYSISKIEKEIDGKFKKIEIRDTQEKIKKLDLSQIQEFNEGDLIKIHLYRKDKNHLTYYIVYRNKNNIEQSSKYPKYKSGSITPTPMEEFSKHSFNIYREDLVKLIDFYVIKSPSIDNSGKAITAQFFNIKENWGEDCWSIKEGSLKRRLMETIEGHKYRVYHKKI